MSRTITTLADLEQRDPKMVRIPKETIGEVRTLIEQYESKGEKYRNQIKEYVEAIHIIGNAKLKTEGELKESKELITELENRLQIAEEQKLECQAQIDRLSRDIQKLQIPPEVDDQEALELVLYVRSKVSSINDYEEVPGMVVSLLEKFNAPKRRKNRRSNKSSR